MGVQNMPIQPFGMLALDYVVASLGFLQITNIKLHPSSPGTTISEFVWATIYSYLCSGAVIS